MFIFKSIVLQTKLAAMGRASNTRLQVSCLNSVSTRNRIVRSRSVQAKTVSSTDSNKISRKKEFGEFKPLKTRFAVGRRIMIVVDSSFQAKSAMKWALSNTVQNQDTIVLVHVTKPSDKCKGSEREMNPKAYKLLQSMKNMCQLERPEVPVEVALVEGKEKGPTLVQEAKNQGVSFLILGQRKRSILWRMLLMCQRNKIRDRVVDYCIENSSCMTIGVRRKSRKLGGYLITTRSHKDFWLLA